MSWLRRGPAIGKFNFCKQFAHPRYSIVQLSRVVLVRRQNKACAITPACCNRDNSPLLLDNNVWLPHESPSSLASNLSEWLVSRHLSLPFPRYHDLMMIGHIVDTPAVAVVTHKELYGNMISFRRIALTTNRLCGALRCDPSNWNSSVVALQCNHLPSRRRRPSKNTCAGRAHGIV